MHVVIVPALSRWGGGIHQYNLTMLRALHEMKNPDREDEFVIEALTDLQGE